MNVIERPRATALGAGHVAAAVIAAWVVYALVGGLDATGQHLLVLGALRIVLFGALLAFAHAVGAHERRLGRVGLAMAGGCAVLYLVGGIGAVATDGWSFDVFASEGDYMPWYAVVIGLSAMLFALGTTLVGVAALSAGKLAVAAILAGVLFPAVLALQTFGDIVGHIVWLTPWMVLAVGVAAASPDRKIARSVTVDGRTA